MKELWRWYVTGTQQAPNSSSALRIAFHLLKFLVLWSLFFFVLYKLMPRQYWPFYKGIIANPLLLVIFPCLYARGILMDFLTTRVDQTAARPNIGGVPNKIGVLREYREMYGKSDFFYRLYVSLGWVGLGSMMIGGLYWFLSLPSAPTN
jgi:hypothetical protein